MPYRTAPWPPGLRWPVPSAHYQAFNHPNKQNIDSTGKTQAQTFFTSDYAVPEVAKIRFSHPVGPVDQEMPRGVLQ